MSAIQTTVVGIVGRGRDPPPGDREYLVQRLVDPDDGGFYRPIGGGIEFGETSDEALEREFHEELGVSVTAGPVVGTMENRFTWGGDPDHELVIARRATFDDRSLYDREQFHGEDAGGDVEYEATWRTLDDLASDAEPLYPEGIEGLLRGETGDGHGHVVSGPE